jgi:hypothetical protein
MSTLLKIDQRFRHVFSVAYRILLVTYSAVIFINYKTIFSIDKYLLLIFIYLLLYKVCYKKNGLISITRLLFDYAFIFATVYGLTINDFFIASFIFIPFLNSNNHSSDKKSILLYLIPLIYFYFFNKDTFSYTIIISFIAFYIINVFGRIRTAYFNFTENLNSCIDDFFLDENSLKRPHRIYKKAIDVLNKTKLITFETEKILCFKIYEDKINLINGSEFIWNYNINNQIDKIQAINKIRNNKTIKDIEFEIDGEVYSKNICFKCEIESNVYLYAIVAKKNSIADISFTPFFNEIVTPFFTRLSKVFETFINQKNIELIKITEMEGKISYVNNAINSMHFMRNKLGPMRNYLDMVNDYNSMITEKDEKDKKNNLKKIIENERNKLSTSLDNILERANTILEKANNPFNVNEVESHSTLKLYVELKRIWELFFDDIRPLVALKLSKELEYKNLKFNTLGLELVFCNWINNIKKYNSGNYSVKLHEDEKYVLITFKNSVSNINDTEIIVKLFNSDDRIEISKRNSHGLIEIKDFLNQMNIDSLMSIQDNELTLNLKFLKYE